MSTDTATTARFSARRASSGGNDATLHQPLIKDLGGRQRVPSLSELIH